MEENIKKEIKNLYETLNNKECEKIIPLAGSGSSRRYFRIVGGSHSEIACYSKNIEENSTFIRLSKYFKDKNLNVPEIYGADNDGEIYLLQDLGDKDLMGLLGTKPVEDATWLKIEKSLESLVEFQHLPEEEWNTLVEFSPFNSALIENDCIYCIENFFKPAGVEIQQDVLCKDVKLLKEKLLSCPEELWGLMYRDFQSRNIMIYAGEPYFIDYQSCRKGPGIYDLVSFAWQAKARFTDGERTRIIDIYCQKLKKYGENYGQTVNENIGYWALFRILQTLGAYGLRGLKERKKHFIDSIPFALDNLLNLFETYRLNDEFPEIFKIARNIKNEKIKNVEGLSTFL